MLHAEGAGCCLTPSSRASQLAPQLPAQEAAEIYTGCRDYVERGVLEDARRLAQFALAAYGAGRAPWRMRR